MRHYRTRLLSRMFGVKPLQRVRMPDRGHGQELGDKRCEVHPALAGFLTPPAQDTPPMLRHLVAKHPKRAQVARNRVVVVIAVQYLVEPRSHGHDWLPKGRNPKG